MLSIAAVVFGLSLAIVAWVYAGYPLALAAWSRLAPREVRRRDVEPTVAIVIAARNERDVLARKVRECLSLDYPTGKLEVVVSLDAPTDGTDAIAAELPGGPVRLLQARRHEGKAAALNRAMAAVNADVIVFCDARQRIAPGAVRALVADLADPDVGAVTGELLFAPGDGPGASGLGLYGRYERALRTMESRIHSSIGATGALYAVRRADLAPLPPGTILDDVVIPMRVVLSGKRTVVEPEARAYDHPCPLGREYDRKVRTLTGNFQLLSLMPELLSPRRNPVFLQFVSHKLGRLLVPYALLALLLSSLAIHEGPFRAALYLQCGLYALAVAAPLARAPRWLLFPSTFLSMNAAAVAAAYHYLRLRRQGPSGDGLSRLWTSGAPVEEQL